MSGTAASNRRPGRTTRPMAAGHGATSSLCQPEQQRTQHRLFLRAQWAEEFLVGMPYQCLERLQAFQALRGEMQLKGPAVLAAPPLQQIVPFETVSHGHNRGSVDPQTLSDCPLVLSRLGAD